MTLPPFLESLLASPPRAGEGVHTWLFKMARQLHAHLPAPEIVALLRERVQGCGRRVPESEIQEAVRNALGCAWTPRGTTTQTARRWPMLSERVREGIISQGGGLVDLWEASPYRLDSNENRTELFIDLLFPGNPLLCVGKSSREFDTKHREEWRGELAAMQLIVPSPMTARTGVTKDGRESAHTLSNTGPRRFLVCEFDRGTQDEQAALILHLASIGPLAVALSSGGKSLHAWFVAQNRPEETIEKFFRYAVSLGADPATWTRSQFVRMPDGQRDNGRRQTVFYFNPKILPHE